jgi:hypothetical protein
MSTWQKEAERQVLSMQNELFQYRNLVASGFSRPGYTSNQSPLWHVSHEKLNGDFALDYPLAYELASRVVSKKPEADWLKDYLDGKLFDPSAGTNDNLGDVTIGRGNLWGNANAVRQSGEAILTQIKIRNATSKIVAKTVREVKINSNMTLYNAENSMRKAANLRVKVHRLPIKTITPKFDKVATTVWRGGVRASVKEVKDMSKLAGLTSKARFFNGGVGGGVLTFAPTVAFDLYDTISRDAHGNPHWNAHQFANAELRNQPGNAVGWGVGVLAGAGAVALGFTGAPVIVIGLIAGIAVQALWNWAGAPDLMPQM